MAKRSNQSSANTEGATAAGKPANAPNTAPGEAVQGQSGGGADGAPAGSQLDGAGLIEARQGVGQIDAEDPSTATAPETAAFGDGGLATLLDPAVAIASAISGDPPPAGASDQQAISNEGSRPELSALRVTGPKKGRRRIGRNFDRNPVTIPAADLSDDDITALLADPALTVETVPLD